MLSAFKGYLLKERATRPQSMDRDSSGSSRNAEGGPKQVSSVNYDKFTMNVRGYYEAKPDTSGDSGVYHPAQACPAAGISGNYVGVTSLADSLNLTSYPRCSTSLRDRPAVGSKTQLAQHPSAPGFPNIYSSNNKKSTTQAADYSPYQHVQEMSV